MKGVNEGILSNFMEDMVNLMQNVRVNGLVLNDKVYLTESEVKESLENYLKVFGSLSTEKYYERFKVRLSEYNIKDSKFKEEVIYWVEV